MTMTDTISNSSGLITCNKVVKTIRTYLTATSLAIMLVTFSPLTMAQEQSVPTNATKIKFPKGTVSSVVDGILPSKKQETWYQFDATKGQYAIINISGKTGIIEVANVGVLTFPSGAQDGTKGGVIYQGCLPENGTYHLRIARNLMATHGGMAGYQAEVIILPTYASEALCKSDKS